MAVTTAETSNEVGGGNSLGGYGIEVAVPLPIGLKSETKVLLVVGDVDGAIVMAMGRNLLLGSDRFDVRITS